FRFLVPQVELVRQAEGVSIAFNIMAGAEDTAMTITGRMLAAIDDLVFDADADMEHCRETTVLSRTDLPDRGQWVDTVVRVLSDIEKGKLAKLVLARRTALEMSKAVSPFALLSGIKNGGSGTYDFCFQVDGANAFVGASPERLFTIQGSTVYSEALAGTRSTASSKIAGNLLDSDKEIAEHNFVVDDVAGALKSLCDNVETIADKQIVTLPNLEHISSAFKGRLRENISIGDIIRSIHPTSAVNGSPRELAMQEIERLEPFGRGLYAGPVGWIGEDCADFAVAIRSAVVAGDVISLYAGAGIVESSDPSLEWEETETKISRFLQAVGQ
ncbi:MAG: isochorismate synthase, partial [Anaerohalosphaera sp.]|nr:isochorismate synthase [Anaerohalosphaera sp.]